GGAFVEWGDAAQRGVVAVLAGGAPWSEGQSNGAIAHTVVVHEAVADSRVDADAVRVNGNAGNIGDAISGDQSALKVHEFDARATLAADRDRIGDGIVLDPIGAGVHQDCIDLGRETFAHAAGIRDTAAVDIDEAALR